MLLGFLRLVDLSPVKPALRAVDDIHAGMTESEVRAILDREFPEGSRFRRNLAMGAMGREGFNFALDPNDGRYNAAVVVIGFEEGKCTGARFLAD